MKPYSIIILNQEIDVEKFDLLYKRATTRVCADGGYNRLKRHCKDTGTLDEPDYIIGDMDSVETDIVNEADKPPKRIYIHDQNRSDLQKVIDFMTIEHGYEQTFIIVGGLGGRFDHEMGSLDALYRYPEHQLILLNAKSLVTLLNEVKAASFHGLPFICDFRART